MVGMCGGRKRLDVLYKEEDERPAGRVGLWRVVIAW